MLEVLCEILEENFSARVFAISSSSRIINLRNGLKVHTVNYDHSFPKNRQYVLIHFAFLTKDKILRTTQQEYSSLNRKIRDDVTRIIQDVAPRSLLYSSSGAVYSQSDEYGITKLEDETYFNNLAQQQHFDIIIPRIFNIAGPYINKVNLYALGDFISQIIAKNSITITATSEVIRSYIHVFDLMEICLSWIFDKNKKSREIIFDTANTDEVELSQLAQLIKNSIDNTSAPIIRSEINQKLKENRYVGNAKIQNSLCEQYGIKIQTHHEIIADTYKYIKEQTK